MNKWNRKKIIEALRETAKKLGYSPSVREVPPALYGACCFHFSSFNKAKKAAKLSINPIKHHRINKNATVVNENLAYILGVKIGDGYWRKRRTSERTSGEIILNVKNLDFAREFEERLKRWSGIQPKFWEKNGKFYVALYSIDAVNIAQRVSLKRINNSTKKVKAYFLKGCLIQKEG